MKNARAYKTGTMRSMFGPDPDGEICKSCEHLVYLQYSKRYYKCRAYGTSSCESTDWGCTWPACGLFTYDESVPLPPGFIPVVESRKHAPRPKEKEPELPGQIDMEELIAKGCENDA